jgi:glycosyltransferase involved in cell wall biosynthesis
MEPIYRFRKILSSSAETLFLLSSDPIGEGILDSSSEFVNIGDGKYTNISSIDYLVLQIVISIKLFKLRSELDLVYFHKGAMGFALPVFVARLSGVGVCVIKIGAFANDRISSDGGSVFLKITHTLQYLSFRLAHGAVAFSQNEIESIPNDQVFIAYSNYRDFDLFDIKTQPSERPFEIGFVSRFSEVKGILNLVEAIENLTDQFPKFRAKLVGDGPCYETVADRVEELERVELTGWVEREELPQHYNDMRYLFVPSVGEGLPTNALEAMGCGAIVVATPVGSLVDLIEDGHRGFFLNDNSAATIEETYDQVRQRDDLNVIAANQREFVVSNYSLTAAQENFRMITQQLVT